MLSFNDKKTLDHRVTNPQGNARMKVEQDIAFLTDRIHFMKQQAHPNTQLIDHYQSMLKSRESVLKWLMDGCDDETCCVQDQHSA